MKKLGGGGVLNVYANVHDGAAQAYTAKSSSALTVSTGCFARNSTS